ncbi:MAG: hypothetical protein IPM94_13140 [bacterium]|nr:hypothetical protein [bacterium]
MITSPRARPRRLLIAVAFALLVAPALRAQDRIMSAPEGLLDKMTGRWVLTGTIAKKPTTHDVDIDWVLNRQYIRIHEVSRDKDASGGIGYEAWIYIVWDPKLSEYALMWLDNTAATDFSSEGVGHAKPDGDRIPFIYSFADGSGIRTTFAYDRTTDTWAWTIHNLDKSGSASPFANVVLVRKD